MIIQGVSSATAILKRDILKSNMEILKARCDMQKLKEERPVA